MAQAISSNSPEHAWAASVVESFEALTGRRTRWDGTVSVSADGAAARLRPDDRYVEDSQSIHLTPEQYTQISQAIARWNDRQEQTGPIAGTAQERQAHWDAVLKATGDVAVQAGQLTGRRALRPDRTAEADAELSEGLASVLVEENLGMVVLASQSNQLLLREGTPDPHFDYSGGPAATTTRDVITQRVFEVKQRDPQSPELSQVSYELLQQPPDARFEAFDAVAGGPLGTDRLSDDVRRDLADTFRDDFHQVVQEGNSRAGTPFSPGANAVSRLSSATVQSIEAAGASAQGNARTGPPPPGQDPALMSARLATTNTAGGQALNGSPTTAGQLNRNSPKPPGIGE